MKKRARVLPPRNERDDAMAREMGYGLGIHEGVHVELSPGLDLWMRGARYGTVEKRTGPVATVRMDNTRVRRLQRIHVMDLKRT